MRELNYASSLGVALLVCLSLTAQTAQAAPKEGAQQARDKVELAWLVAKNTSAELAQAAPQASSPPQEDFTVFLQRQAALEVQIALKLYASFDDYRAIGALRRYQAIANSDQANFLASLMIGQIYHRNTRHTQAAFNFEQAIASAPSTQDRVWAYLLTVQQLCLPLSFYYECRQRLNEAVQIEQISRQQRDLIDYQRLYVDVVLRSPYVTDERAKMFAQGELQDKALGLIKRNEEFYDLELQRPWLAGTLSAVLPGAGQFYNGRYLDGAISLGVNGLFGAATYYAFVEAESIPLGVVSALFLTGFYVGNIVNAYTDAQRINAQAYLKFFEDLKIDYWPRVQFQIQQNSAQFGYTFDWPGPKPGQREQAPATPQPPAQDTQSGGRDQMF